MVGVVCQYENGSHGVGFWMLGVAFGLWGVAFWSHDACGGIGVAFLSEFGGILLGSARIVRIFAFRTPGFWSETVASSQWRSLWPGRS